MLSNYARRWNSLKARRGRRFREGNSFEHDRSRKDCLLRNEMEILIRDEDDAIADACIRLLTDDELCDQLGSRANTKARFCYNLSEIQDELS
jgi:hypothetical protein